MKPRIPAIFLLPMLALACISCKIQPSPPAVQSAPRPSASIAAIPAKPSDSARDSDRCDSLLPRLVELENAIRTHSSSEEAIRRFTDQSFDSVSGCFFVAGKGTFNTLQPTASRVLGRGMAAQYDAKRWAVFAKIRSLGRNMSFAGKFSGEITYSALLCEHAARDTLFVLLKVPLGSVVVR